MKEQNQYQFPLTGNVRAKESAQYLTIGISTYWLWVKEGKIKPPTKHGSRVSVWSAEYIRDLAENGVGEVA